MRKLPYLLILVLLCFSVNVYAKSILILGDSISTAYGFEAKYGWVELFKQRLHKHQLNYTVINASIAGSTTANGLARLADLLSKYKPDLTLIELGGNDTLLGIQLDAIKMNIIRLIALCREHGSQVVILGISPPPNYGSAYRQTFIEMYKQLRNDGVVVVPLYSDSIAKDAALLQADLIHPSKEAQPIILDRVWPEISKMLKQ